MCISCWREEGSHQIVNEKVKQAAELIGKIYEIPEGSVGALAHIVVDDWNLDDTNIDFCLNLCKTFKQNNDKDRQIVEACSSALNALKELSEPERYSALALYEEFFNI